MLIFHKFHSKSATERYIVNIKGRERDKGEIYRAREKNDTSWSYDVDTNTTFQGEHNTIYYERKIQEEYIERHGVESEIEREQISFP